MFSTGIINTIKPPNKLYLNDPKYIIKKHDLHNEPPPIFESSRYTNTSNLSDRFVVVKNTTLTPVIAKFIDPIVSGKRSSITNLTPPINVSNVNFLKLQHSINTLKENKIISTKPDFNSYIKTIAFIQKDI